MTPPPPFCSPQSTGLYGSTDRRSPPQLRRVALALALAAVSSVIPAWAQTAPASQPKPQTPSADSSTTDSSAAPATEPAPATPPSVNQAKPAAPPAATAAGTPGVDNEKYVIGPEDNIQITVWREPTLSGVLPVRPDGMISLALLGDVKAAGLTPMQLSSDISTRLRKYIQDPSVTVAVTAVNSQRVFLVGEVGKVGPIPLTPDMTPLQAISTAGGPTPYANTKHIYLLRGTGAKQQKIPYNYKKALKGEAQPGVTLQPGDTIVVP